MLHCKRYARGVVTDTTLFTRDTTPQVLVRSWYNVKCLGRTITTLNQHWKVDDDIALRSQKVIVLDTTEYGSASQNGRQ
jgi:hypothetical protein